MGSSKGEGSLNLEKLFVSMEQKGILEGNDYQSVDMLLIFVAVFIDHSTGVVRYAPMTDGHKSTQRCT